MTSGHHLTFTHLYEQGGTTLRLETDATPKKSYGGEVKGVTAHDIVGVDCNRAVSFAAHEQWNSDVHVTDVTAVSCNEAVVQSAENARGSGHFLNSSVDGVTIVGGSGAQVPEPGHTNRWSVQQSARAFDVHPAGLDWSVDISGITCSGRFAAPSDPITIDGVAHQQPRCT